MNLRVIFSLLIVLCGGILFGMATNTFYNVLDFNVVPNDGKDDTKTINDIIKRVYEDGGGIIYFPAGVYTVMGSIEVLPNVTIQGVWQTPHGQEYLGMTEDMKGTVFAAYGGRGDSYGEPLFNLHSSSSIRGITIFYPEQDPLNIVPYPPSIAISKKALSVKNISVEDVTLINPYIGIDFSRPHELHYIRNVFGCPLKIGVKVDGCTDIGRIENVHFNPNFWTFFASPGRPVGYISENLTGFIFGRSDWEYVLNTFVWGAKIGYEFESSGCNGNFVGIGADWCSQSALLVRDTQAPGILIVNGEFVNASDCLGPTVEVKAGNVFISNSSFWGPTQKIASINDGMVVFSACNFLEWDANSLGVPAVEAKGGSLIVQGSYFAKKGLAIYIGEKVKAANIFGNIFYDSHFIINKSGGDIQIGLNSFLNKE
ncbi:glycosyl hydrolase family 28-related protein [Thermotoga sp.]|uniref:glycosyl hydrolase family 28-related protein n=1 Tax=Thermotoga sp. TaxID=28240 RepID=UPI0025FA1DCC|nr:glycosyl hydrolase family 28-related protein [Thermotoga sp.]MCD6551427.1 hypothetical protein [Thermotoga sp.]